MLTGGRALHVLVPVGGAQSQQQAMKKGIEPPASPSPFSLCMHPHPVRGDGDWNGAQPHDGCRTEPGTNKSRTRS